MARASIRILEEAEKRRAEKAKAEGRVPAITRMPVAKADSMRRLTNVGEHIVYCDLRCHGKGIPPMYSHLDNGEVLNVCDFGVQVPGHEDGLYLGQLCRIAKGERFCATGNAELKKAGERI